MAHLLQQVYVEMIVSKLALICSTKTRLKRECVRDPQFFPTHHSSCRVLCLLSNEVAIAKVENIAVFVHQARENSFLESINFTAISEHEYVFLARVSVQVTDKEDVSVLLQLFDHVLRVVDGRVHFTRRIYPASVEVNSGQIASTRSVYYTVWV